MQVLGIVAPEDTRTLADRVADRLAERGSVGVVRDGDGSGDETHHADDSSTPPAGRTGYDLGEDGWRASGPDLSLPDALDRLAREHEYAVVAGFPSARIPRLVVGDEPCRGEVVYRAPTADDVDVEAAIDALADAEPYETLGSLVARVKRSPEAERAGAIATFIGRVRARDAPDDDRTERLEFERYEGVAEKRLATIRGELEARDGVFAVRMHHRTGVIDYGDDIVFVVVLAGHREEAFRAVEDGINRLKAEVPIFKKEVTDAEEFWVHERP